MKNVVITGSTRGIGFSMAKEFLKNGCNVTLSGRGEVLSENAQAELSPYEGKYLYVPCNVQDKKKHSKSLGRILQALGKYRYMDQQRGAKYAVYIFLGNGRSLYEKRNQHQCFRHDLRIPNRGEGHDQARLRCHIQHGGLRLG